MRAENGIDREQLSDALKISESFLGSLEYQKKNPSFGLALRICQVLGESMERLFPYGNADVGSSLCGFHGTGEQPATRGVGASRIDASPRSPAPDREESRGSASKAKAAAEDGDQDLPRPIRAWVLSDRELCVLHEPRAEPVGVLDAERAKLREHSTYAERCGYEQGCVYDKSREKVPLFAYEHVLGSWSIPEGAAYGPQKARHPDNPSPLVHRRPSQSGRRSPPCRELSSPKKAGV